MIQNRVFNTHEFINSNRQLKRDSTYEYGIKQIDTVLMIIRVLGQVQGCELIDFN